jgi:hypothetical protein
MSKDEFILLITCGFAITYIVIFAYIQFENMYFVSKRAARTQAEFIYIKLNQYLNSDTWSCIDTDDYTHYTKVSNSAKGRPIITFDKKTRNLVLKFRHYNKIMVLMSVIINETGKCTKVLKYDKHTLKNVLYSN